MTAEQRRHSLLEYVQRAATLVSVDALPLDDLAPAAVITDASTNVAMLCDALHRALTHGLLAPTPPSLLMMPWSSSSSSSSTSTSSSTSGSLWSALQTLGVAQLSAAAREAVQFIAADVADDELRAAALVRWLLNERAMDPLMRHLFAHPKLPKLYEPDALVRREDTQSVLSMIAAALSNLQFRLCVAASDHHALAAAPPAPAVSRHTRPIAVRGATVPAIDSDEPVASIEADDSIIRRRRPVQTAANPAIVDSSPVDSTIDAVLPATVSPRVTSPPQAIPSRVADDTDNIATSLQSNQSDVADVQLEESSFREPSVLEAQFESPAAEPIVHIPSSSSIVEDDVSKTTVIDQPPAPVPALTEEPAEVVAVDVHVPDLQVEPTVSVEEPAQEVVQPESATVPIDDKSAVASTSTSTSTTKEFRLKKNKTKQGGFVFEVKR